MSVASYIVFAAQRLNLSGAAAGNMNPPQAMTMRGVLIHAFLLDRSLAARIRYATYSVGSTIVNARAVLL